MEEKLYFDSSVQFYSVATNLTLNLTCNGISVQNTGTNTAFFDNDPIAPGASKAIGGNRNEIFVGRHEISFLFPAIGAINQVTVTQKYYVDPPKFCK